MTKLLTRDDIIKADDIKAELVDMCPFGWGGHVYIKGQSAKERAEFEAYVSQAMTSNAMDNAVRFRAKLLVATIVDAEKNGKPLFREQDIDALNEKSAGALDFLYEKTQKLSGFRKEDIDALTRNLPEGQSDDSTSD